MADGIIKCPVCGNEFHRALYDFYFIHCNVRRSKNGGIEKGCGTFFDKMTGEILATNDQGQVLGQGITVHNKE